MSTGSGAQARDSDSVFHDPSFSLSLSFLVGESKPLLPSVQGASLIDRTPP